MNQRIVIIGAGGMGVSNIVHILWDLGYQQMVCIDPVESQITLGLRKKGIDVTIGMGNVEMRADDIVIYSSSFEDSREIHQVRELKKEHHTPLLMWDYFQFLGEMSKYFKTVGFTGTNGKSSSSAMGIFAASQVLSDFGIGIVGALVPDFGGKSCLMNEEKKSDFRSLFDYIFTGRKLDYSLVKKYYFFLEACEYQRHFLTLDLDYAVVTNVDLDHTDYYRDLSDYESAFREMGGKVKNQIFVLETLRESVFSGFDHVKKLDVEHFSFHSIWGKHNDENGSLVKGLLLSLAGKEKESEIVDAMLPFKGIWRRLEFLTETKNGAQIFSDYGHVAQSLDVGYQALSEKYPGKKIICVFQPHQIHRILVGWNDFVEVAKKYDQFFVYDIYAAREHFEDFAHEEIFASKGIQSLDQLGIVFAEACGGMYLRNFSEVESVFEQVNSDTVVIVFSAGDIDFLMRKYFGLV